MIVNPIICEKCKNELQPEDIYVGFSSDSKDLVMVCRFCENEVIIKEKD